MKEFIRFTLPSGHVFELNARVIADDRAESMFKLHPDEFKTLDEAREDSMGLFDDDYEVWDWFANNMNQDEVLKKHGRLVGFEPPELDWNHVERTHTDERATMQQITSENVLDVPVEMIIAAMAEGGQFCAVNMIMAAATGEPQSAIAFIHGGPEVVNAYVTGLKIITNKVSEKHAADAAKADKH